MKWLPDDTGRFRWRPYYDAGELDTECERIVSRFLEQKYGVCCYPVSTGDLTVMIEQDASDLDLYADLSGSGEDIEGLTDFFPNRKPAVKIAAELSLDVRREHRLRTTLAHEYGHVKFHSFLWDLVRWENLSGDKGSRRKYYRIYTRITRSGAISGFNPGHLGSMIDDPTTDWMEWQAGYACGAFLMPVTPVRQIVKGFLSSQDCRGWLQDDSEQAGELVATVSGIFDISEEAARARLLRLGYLQKVTGCVAS